MDIETAAKLLMQAEQLVRDIGFEAIGKDSWDAPRYWRLLSKAEERVIRREAAYWDARGVKWEHR